MAREVDRRKTNEGRKINGKGENGGYKTMDK